jgi:chromosome condensin MukBEF ATPase and DNA-binding subunit MukB
MHPAEMNREQRFFLTVMNNRLSGIEKQLRKEALEIITSLNKRTANKNDWISAYDIGCTMEFLLRKDDPAYAKRKDNILASFDETLGILRYSDKSLLASEENWNNIALMESDCPEKPEHHCWFYHQLYDHTGISWEDILRIGDIRVNIHISLQHDLKLTGKEVKH